jgi:RimJ/RimL family protein N-acetyltransferase
MAGGDVTLAITLAGRPVGSTGLHRRGPPHHVAIGYFVDKDHLRMGIATEATAILTAAALGLDPLAAVAGVNVVEIHHDRANVRSRRVPERLGYRFAGESPNAKLAPGEEGVDCAWEMTLERWRARPQTQ